MSGFALHIFSNCWTYEVKSGFTFLETAKTYNRCDVFSTIELKNDIIANYADADADADVTEDDSSIVQVW